MLEYPNWLMGTPSLPKGDLREHTMPACHDDGTEIQDEERRHSNQPLMSKDIERLRTLEAAGVPRYEIARTCHVDSSTLRKYLGRKSTWSRRKLKQPDEKIMALVKDIMERGNLTRRGVSVKVECVHSLVDSWMRGGTPSTKYRKRLEQLHASLCQPNSKR